MAILRPMNASEIEEVDKEKLQDTIDDIISQSTLNVDGSYDVHGDVNLHRFNLKRLPLKFNKVYGYFDCSSNQLTNLEGCPRNIYGFFNCAENKLTSLMESPEYVDGDFYCYKNQVTSFRGCPRKINGNFYCYANRLSDLKGCPKYIEGVFICWGNKIKFNSDDIRKYCNVKINIVS